MTAKAVTLLLAVLALALSTPDSGDAQVLSTYDTFSTATFNPRRWFGEEGRTFGGVRTEAARAIVSGQARIENRTFGDRFSNSGSSSTRNSLIAMRAPAITSMRATITTRSLQLIGCAANPTAAGARARLFGFFFNAGDSILASLVNEVFAGVQVARFSNSTDPAGVFRIAAFTGMCSDENCFTSVSLGGVELGTVALNTPAAVQMTWDAANNRFTFQLNATTPVHLPYTVADTFPAAFPSKRIEVSNTVPRCTATTRPVSFLRADFDNVMVNTSALSARAPTLAAPADATMMEPDGDEMIGRVD